MEGRMKARQEGKESIHQGKEGLSSMTCLSKVKSNYVANIQDLTSSIEHFSLSE